MLLVVGVELCGVVGLFCVKIRSLLRWTDAGLPRLGSYAFSPASSCDPLAVSESAAPRPAIFFSSRVLGAHPPIQTYHSLRTTFMSHTHTLKWTRRHRRSSTCAFRLPLCVCVYMYTHTHTHTHTLTLSLSLTHTHTNSKVTKNRLLKLLRTLAYCSLLFRCACLPAIRGHDRGYVTCWRKDAF